VTCGAVSRRTSEIRRYRIKPAFCRLWQGRISESAAAGLVSSDIGWGYGALGSMQATQEMPHFPRVDSEKTPTRFAAIVYSKARESFAADFVVSRM